jgi:K+-transporting ATPase ATPase C chain
MPATAPHDADPLDRASWRAAVAFAGVILVLFGLLYSLSGTGLGRVLFPHQATGSLIVVDGRARASELVAQPFVGDGYFHPRPSAAGYDPMAVSGSNMARSNPDLRARIDASVAEVAAREGLRPEDVPGELVTQSGGGLDPHVTPAGALVQADRVARARGLDRREVEALVAAHVEPPVLGVLGQPRVNVVRLNLALDALP